MSKLINGSYNFNYASIIGGTGMTSDMVSDITTGHTLSYDIADLENHIGGSGDIVIGATNANFITINSGSTIYNNNEIITLKDNSSTSYILGSAGNTNMMVLDTSDAGSNVNLSAATNLIINNTNDPASYTDITSALVVKGGIACSKKIACNNINSIGSCSVGSLVSSGSMSGNALSITGTTASTTYLTGAIICSGGMGISGAIYSNSTINVASSVSCYGFTNGGSNTLGNTTDSSGLLTGALQCSGGISISKKIYTGSGIMLPTSGGTASLLNYYEEYTITNLWAPNSGGGWLNSTNTMTLIRIGNIVNLKIKAFSGDALSSYIKNSAILPSRFCPLSTIQFPIQVINLSTTQLGLLSVLSTGYTNIYSSITSSNFGSGSGSGLLVDTFVSWTII